MLYDRAYRKDLVGSQYVKEKIAHELVRVLLLFKLPKARANPASFVQN